MRQHLAFLYALGLLACGRAEVGQAEQEPDLGIPVDVPAPSQSSLAIKGFAPERVPTRAGSEVLVTGRGFHNQLQVRIGDLEVGEVEIHSAELLAFKSPDLSPGRHKVWIGSADAQPLEAGVLEVYAGRIALHHEAVLVEGMGQFVAGDINSDGFDDVIAALENGETTVFLNASIGARLNPFTTLPAADTPLALEDLTADGAVDLLTTSGVFVGDGSGGFRMTASFSSHPEVVDAPYRVSVADFDQDGRIEIALFMKVNGPCSIVLYEVQTDGHLEFEQAHSEELVQCFRVIGGDVDVNHDGMPDLLVAGAGGISTLFGPDLAPERAQTVPFPETSFIWDIALANIGVDQEVDLLVAGELGTTVPRGNQHLFSLQGAPDGTFSVPEDHGRPCDEGVWSTRFADTGPIPTVQRSLLLCNFKDGTAQVLAGTWNASKWTLLSNHRMDGPIDEAHRANLDGFLHSDFLLTTSGSLQAMYAGRRAHQLTRSAGLPDAWTFVRANLGTLGSIAAATPTDDGTLVVRTATWDGTDMVWSHSLRVDPDEAPSNFPPNFERLVACDMNGDGRDDLAAIFSRGFLPLPGDDYSYDTTFIQVILSEASGLALGPKLIQHTVNPDVVAADWNGDGTCDLLSLEHRGSPRSIVWFNNADGFTQSGPFQVTQDPVDRPLETFAAADLDRDGLPDLVDLREQENIVFWRNRGDGTGFAPSALDPDPAKTEPGWRFRPLGLGSGAQTPERLWVLARDLASPRTLDLLHGTLTVDGLVNLHHLDIGPTLSDGAHWLRAHIADLNGDHREDAWLHVWPNRLVPVLSSPQDGLELDRTLDVPLAEDAAVVDFDGDGLTDLVSVSPSRDRLLLFRNESH